MRADAFLAAAEALPIRDLSDLVGAGGLVVVAPHPDDESLGCGGLIAEAFCRGIDTRLLVVSDGVGSHRHSRLFPPERLKILRETETIEAAAILGLPRSRLHFLDLPDAAVPTQGEPARRATQRMEAAVHECAARTICVTWRYDPHCDHEAAARLVDEVRRRVPHLRVFEYPIWGWTLPPGADVGPEPAGMRLDITRHVEAKRQAIFAHRSQTSALIDDDPSGFRLDPAMIERFVRPFEIFLETWEPA